MDEQHSLEIEEYIEDFGHDKTSGYGANCRDGEWHSTDGEYYGRDW